MTSPLTKEEITKKMHEFIYYFVKKVEGKLTSYSKIMNPNLIRDKTSVTTLGSILSSLAKNVPIAGKTLSDSVGKLDRKFSEKRTRKRTLVFKSLIEFYEAHKEVFRRVLVKASYEIFCCFEKQLLPFLCDKNSIWLIEELGNDADRRFLLHIYQNGYTSVTIKAVVSSVVFSNWDKIHRIKLLKKSPSVKTMDYKRKTHYIYPRTALYDKEANIGYINKISNIGLYGFRLKFSEEEIVDYDRVEEISDYNYLINMEELNDNLNVILEFIVNKDLELLSTEDLHRNQEQIVEQNDLNTNLLQRLVAQNNLLMESIKYINENQIKINKRLDSIIGCASELPEINNKIEERQVVFTKITKKFGEEEHEDKIILILETSETNKRNLELLESTIKVLKQSNGTLL